MNDGGMDTWHGIGATQALVPGSNNTCSFLTVWIAVKKEGIRATGH